MGMANVLLLSFYCCLLAHILHILSYAYNYLTIKETEKYYWGSVAASCISPTNFHPYTGWELLRGGDRFHSSLGLQFSAKCKSPTLLAKCPRDLNPNQGKAALPQLQFVNSFVFQVILEKHSLCSNKKIILYFLHSKMHPPSPHFSRSESRMPSTIEVVSKGWCFSTALAC